MSWTSVDPDQPALGTSTIAPLIFASQHDLYAALLQGAIDPMTSDPRTLDMLSMLIGFVEPKVIVEVGTYRGIGTVAMAETLRFHNLPGHI